MSIVILHNKHSKESRQFVEDNPSYQVIDWYGDENSRQLYMQQCDLAPYTMPAVVDTEKKLLCAGPQSIQEALDFFDTYDATILKQKQITALDQRNKLLIASDAFMLVDFPRGSATEQEILDYRQALRDVPEQAEFPGNIDWPIKPL